MTVATALGISLRVGCDHASCAELAGPLLSKLGRGYESCSVMEIPGSLDEWRAEHRTARKRAHRARARGYVAAPLRRELRAGEIHAINTSKAIRQKRPMSAGYLERHEFSPLPEYPCGLHQVRTHGVYAGHEDGQLVGYLVMYRCGDLALVSQILGHGDYERDEIMYGLFEFALAREIETGPGFVVYNRHDSGTDGLRFFKERLGFREEQVEWLP